MRFFRRSRERGRKSFKEMTKLPKSEEANEHPNP
jgi:hypothetical protein